MILDGEEWVSRGICWQLHIYRPEKSDIADSKLTPWEEIASLLVI